MIHGGKNMKLDKYAQYGPTFVRIVLGLLFIGAGYGKLMNTAGTAAFFASLGIPMATQVAWLVLASEIVFGLALVAGFKTRYAVWPLAAIMLAATLLVVIPGGFAKGTTNLFFHLLAVAALVHLHFTGPGALAIKTR